ncbi:hypothetical protein AB0M46_23590 [Dactylosporangium sp. NPDC051485]|uniref:hypothetical protein n=1 Tax=Dactylosporangium sp. NPDC051485 TaxID=3154846 RepID=UPI00343F167B
MLVEDSPCREHVATPVSPSRSMHHALIEARVGRLDRSAIGADVRLDKSAISGRSPVADQYTVRSLLICDGCDRPLQASLAADGEREYVFLCGCRRNGVKAALVERLVRDRVESASVLLVTGVEELPAVFRRLFAEVRIGDGPEELEFVWRL